MIEQPCLFCSRLKHKVESNKDYICATDVQILLSADQEELKRAHQKAIDLGYFNKVNAIELFLISEAKSGKQPAAKSVKRSPDRKGTVRNVRTQERTVRQIEDRQTTAVL